MSSTLTLLYEKLKANTPNKPRQYWTDKEINHLNDIKESIKEEEERIRYRSTFYKIPKNLI